MVEEADGRTVHVVFAEDGRHFQLMIQYRPFSGEELFTPALSPLSMTAKRYRALKRLADLAQYGALRSHLYPPETRAPRYALILQALDGALAGARHRDIAVGLFGRDRVGRDWSLPGNHLRDHVRRAIAQGRALLGDGALRLIG